MELHITSFLAIDASFSLLLILLGTAHLRECPRGVVLVDELKDPNQGSPDDDRMTED